MQEKENELVASMRSVNNFDITQCLRKVSRELFSAFGGHAMAGGFTLPKENLEEFMKRVEKAGNEHINPAEFVSTLSIDCEIGPDELSFDTRHKLDRLEPFGQNNPEPNLLIKGVKLLDVKSVGQTAEHLQLPMEYRGKKYSAIAFRFGQHLDKIDPAIPHDVVFNLQINEWNGMKKLQLRVVDMRPSE